MIEISPRLNPEEVLKDLQFDPQGRWATPVVNRLKLADSVAIRHDVIIKDDTFRESTNMTGAAPTNEQKLVLAKKLEAAGIREIVGGHAGMKAQCEFMRMVKEACPKLLVHAYVDFGDWQRGIAMAVDAGADAIWMPGALNPSPVFAGRLGSRYAYWSPDFDLECVLESATAAIKTGKDAGKLVSIGRAPQNPAIFYKALDAYVKAGADRICITDGKGCYTPQAMAYMVKRTRDAVGPNVKIEVHSHDDFGLALANSLECVRASCDIVDCVLNGFSHRAGNCSLDQIVLALEVLYGVPTGVDVSQIKSLADLAAEVFGVPTPAQTPHIGQSAYAYGGVHVGALLQEGWFLWETIDAAAIGQTRYIVWTPTALERHGLAGPVAVKIRTMGFDPTEAELEAVFAKLRSAMADKKYATDEELEAIVHEVFGK